jgi:hypothetical protein
VVATITGTGPTRTIDLRPLLGHPARGTRFVRLAVVARMARLQVVSHEFILRVCTLNQARPHSAARAATATGAATPVGTGSVCRPRQATTVAANARVRVYSVPGRFGGRHVVACLYRTGRRLVLGVQSGREAEDFEHVGPVALSGAIVGYQITTMDHYGNGGYEIAVRDLATGRLLHYASQEGGGFVGAPSPEARNGFVMDAVGSVAWIAKTPGSDGQPSFTVFKSDASRASQVLDAGSGIDPRSLVLRQTTLAWTDGGATRAARLAP